MAQGPHVALLNNLGGASVLEMSVLAHELIGTLISARISHVVGPASMMTSREMRRFSVSAFPAGAADTAAPAA